ncbi:hypothetical protein ABIB53_001832, partial [Janibacter sp. UYMM211]
GLDAEEGGVEGDGRLEVDDVEGELHTAHGGSSHDLK